MCGIAGILNLDQAPASMQLVEAMTDAMIYRGPDDEGHFAEGPCALGHRRLSIIDLSSAAHQPMATPDGRYLLIYNGELYNYRALRVELEGAGWRFRSASDTEVMLYALVQWGKSALLRLNGMFAFALWDRTEQRLLLARDRFGVKPLYYCVDGKSLLFASEAKGILAHGALRANLDLEGLAEYLQFQNFFSDRTLFSGIRILPAGTWLEAQPGREPSRGQYWDFDFRDADESSPADLVEELDRRFVEAVSRQLVSDVPLGSYLSGGMDTGAITAVAARQIANLCSFTVGFDMTSASGLELGFDERPQAERMSYLFGTEHYEMVLKSGDMERSLAKVVWHLEEPRVGQSYPNFYAAKLASRFGKVVLSGAGGDELFAGYPWRYYRAVVNSDFDDYTDKYFGFWQRLLANGDYQRVLAPIWNDVKRVDARDIFRSVFRDHASRVSKPEDYVNHSLYFEAKTFLHGLLVVEDKLSMAHSLESRVPFLDNDLVDLAMHMPVRHKLGRLNEVMRLDENEPGGKLARYFEKTRDGKLILRTVMKRYVPADIADGIKKGFSAPDASWFRGESIDYVRRILLRNDARIWNYLDRTATQALVLDHLEGRANRRLLVWSLLNLETWLDLFMGSTVTVSTSNAVERRRSAIVS
ncbi:MAG TPA: asparagine synthase (glutamine-hydrolyzing) [Xanthobacteraceae bacterium]|nr:asparagine synthase (glutamine-hydrolyzing) [Xanthobacteraceae bacterium]